MTQNDGKTGLSRPWENEPDEWSGTFHGLECLAVRSWAGSWCGYVRVPEAHPFFGHHYEDEVPAPPNWRERNVNIDEVGVLNVFTLMLQESAGEGPVTGHAPIKVLLAAHWGLTWAAELDGRDGWYFGFDCGHAGDLQPGLVQHYIEIGAPDWIIEGHRSHNVYRTLEYVIHNIEHLAQQLVDVVAPLPEIKVPTASRE